ncbi:MAG: sodium-dependent transporter [bacterium]|nr:sodium-dependent transporter [bacterium]MBU1917915.1 sodium-dependent transporter [bacterium]
MTNNRSQWSNPFLFILASTGAAVGLGNIWRFPYLAGVNGGGAFVLVYVFSIVIIALPLFVTELYIGQTSQKNTVSAFEVLHRKGSPWQGIGVMAIIAAILILSFYSVVGGWVLDFSYRSLVNEFGRAESADQIKMIMTNLFASPGRQLFWHFIFMLLTAGIVVGGVEKGLERWNKVLMPSLFVLLLGLLLHALFLKGAPEALAFLFKPDFSKLTGRSVLEAVGQAFFSLGLAMGIVITFGSYFKREEKILRVAITVSILDTLIALLAGIVVFSVVYTYGFKADSGPTLIFQTLPVLFAKMPGGYFVAVAFFLLVTFAAITSAMSLLEVVITFWIEKFNTKRKTATIVVSTIIFVLGIFCALSFNILSSFTIFGFTVFDLFDKVSSSLLLPLGGILTALFLGWVLGPRVFLQVLGDKGVKKYISFIYLWSMRVLAPIALIIILIKGLLDL